MARRFRNGDNPNFDYLINVQRIIQDLDYFVLMFDPEGKILEDESYQKSQITKLSYTEYKDRIKLLSEYLDTLYQDVNNYNYFDAKVLTIQSKYYHDGCFSPSFQFQNKLLIKITNNINVIKNELSSICYNRGIDFEDLKYVVELELKKKLADKLIQ